METLKSIFIGMLIFTILPADGSICKFPGKGVQNNSSEMKSHIFNDPVFWQHYQHVIHSRSWKCNFPSDILVRDLEKDASLYKDDTILRKRRHGVNKWLKNDTQWTNIILGVSKEIADSKLGVYSSQLKELHLLEAMVDFVEHLNCFYTVATVMDSKGFKVKALSQNSSKIHDIDKLDPVMLVGYSEKFEDNKTTSVWDSCVDRHTHVNPHHQAHCLWQDDCCEENAVCGKCVEIMNKALKEMVCDKVSRRLQKNLNGTVGEDMWNVDIVFFKGLPQSWLDKAFHILESLK